MKKRWLSLIAVGMVVCLCASGCQSGTGENQGEDGQITITVPDLITAATGVNRFVAQRQQEFDEKYPNIKVNHVSPPAGDTSHMTEYLTTTFMGENSPVYMTVSSLDYVNDLYNQGMAADIKPYLSEDSNFYQMYDYVQETFTRDGEVIAFPATLEVPLLGFYNDALVAGGYDPASFTCETWDDYYEIAKAIDTEEQSGASLYLYEYFLWPNNWFSSNDAAPAVQNDDGTITLDMANDRMVETIEFFRKLYNENLTNKNVSYANLADMLNLIYNKEVASFTFYPTWLVNLQPYGIEPSEITLVQFPKGPSAAEQSSSVIASAHVFNARKSPEELQAAVTYLEFMQGVDFYNAQATYAQENDIVTFSLPPYPSIEWWNGMTENGIPQGWIDTTKAALENGSISKLRSTAFTSYMTTQLPLLVTDSSRDIRQTLLDAQETATNEWLTEYNQNVLLD